MRIVAIVLALFLACFGISQNERPVFELTKDSTNINNPVHFYVTYKFGIKNCRIVYDTNDFVVTKTQLDRQLRYKLFPKEEDTIVVHKYSLYPRKSGVLIIDSCILYGDDNRKFEIDPKVKIYVDQKVTSSPFVIRQNVKIKAKIPTNVQLVIDQVKNDESKALVLVQNQKQYLKGDTVQVFLITNQMKCSFPARLPIVHAGEFISKSTSSQLTLNNGEQQYVEFVSYKSKKKSDIPLEFNKINLKCGSKSLRANIK